VRKTDLPRMKHAGAAALDSVEDVLAAARRSPAVREKSRGCFHHRSRAFLHFHEEDGVVHADLRLADDWKRFRVVTKSERAALLRALRARLREISAA
jgi:hypothetical protein